MKWIKIDSKNLPKNEVLAANFKPRTFGFREKIIGYLREDLGEVICENENELLGGCTHFIDIDKFDAVE